MKIIVYIPNTHINLRIYSLPPLYNEINERNYHLCGTSSERESPLLITLTGKFNVIWSIVHNYSRSLPLYHFLSLSFPLLSSLYVDEPPFMSIICGCVFFQISFFYPCIRCCVFLPALRILFR